MSYPLALTSDISRAPPGDTEKVALVTQPLRGKIKAQAPISSNERACGSPLDSQSLTFLVFTCTEQEDLHILCVSIADGSVRDFARRSARMCSRRAGSLSVVREKSRDF